MRMVPNLVFEILEDGIALRMSQSWRISAVRRIILKNSYAKMFDKLYCFNCDKIKNEYRIPQILKIHPLKNKLGDDKETS